jgi:uncharacterized protein YebE (UPF0316 family)
MNLSSMFSQEVILWVVLPLMIFIAGLAYVSLGTLRIIFIAKGRRRLSPAIGFLEVSIWLIAISQVMSNVTNIWAYLAYAAGFAVGNYVGILLEEKLAIGIQVVRIILTEKDEELRDRLAEAGYGVTTVDGQGINGKVKIIFTIVQRKDMPEVTQIITDCHANAFISVEDARSVTEGVFPMRSKKQ